MSTQVNEWREENYERNLFQSRVDSTKYRIRKELKAPFPNEHTLRHLFTLLDNHENTLAEWKRKMPTMFKSKSKKVKK